MLDDMPKLLAEAVQTETIWRGAAGPVSPPDAQMGTEALDGAPARPVRKPFLGQSERWYCVRHENYEGARARLSLIAKGFHHVHWPRAVLRPRRSHDQVVPIFENYLFVAFDHRRGGWGEVKRADSVLAILGLREVGRPVAVPSGEIERLIQLAGDIDGVIDLTGDAAERKRLAERPDILPAGADVTFVDTELFAQPALLRADRGRERVELMMTWFGAERPVSASRDRLKAIPRKAT